MGRKRTERNAEPDGLRRIIFWLFAGSALAALKVIFVDYTLDEEYQVVMAYRRLMGDHLFGTMWEPHQTSAFACVWLMGIFRAVTGGTTGVVLFLRVCTTVIQAFLAWWLYRVCRDYTRREYAFMLGLCYFNISPKIIQIPEFSNLQVWFFTVTVLSLMEYYGKGAGHGRPWQGRLWHGRLWRRRLWLVLAGVGMAFEVLSYPSCLVLFPVFLVCIFLQSRGGRAGGVKHGLADCLIFAGVCGVSALFWLGYVLYHVPLEDFLRNVGYVLSFDPTHDLSFSTDSKLEVLAGSVRSLALPLLVIIMSGLLLWLLPCGLRKRKGQEAGLRRSTLAVLLVLAAEAVQVFYWVVLQRGYEEPMIHLLVIFLSAAMVWKLADGRRKAFLTGLIGSAVSIAAVIYMSDLGAWYAIPHGMLGELFAVMILIYGLEGELGEKSESWVRLLLLSLLAVSIFGKGFTLRAGKIETNTILGVRGIVKEGPAAGIFLSYIQAYTINCTYEEYEELVEEGADCLIVTNINGTAGTSPYMFKNCNICHYSIVDPTSYDGTLLLYWSLYPEKQPEVIAVDNWFGQLAEGEDSWIMQYIENDFHYSRTYEGMYVRYYFK